MTKIILLLLLSFSLSAQTYKFESCFNRSPTKWIPKSEFGTVIVTKDSIIILSNKSVLRFKIVDAILLGKGDIVFNCGKSLRVRLIARDTIKKRFELQTSDTAKYEKYYLTINE
jgi:hypothetical protein